MNNTLFLFLSCGLIGVISAVIHYELKGRRRRESANTPLRSRAISKRSAPAIRPPTRQAAAPLADAPRSTVAAPTPTKLRDLLPQGSLGFAVLDLETTHLGVKQARLVEIAITLIDPQGRIEKRWDSLVNPEEVIANSLIHGISNAMVEPAPSFSALAPTIGALLHGRVLVAHNLHSFDRPILENCFARCGVGEFDPGDGVDTMPSPRLKLQKLCEAYGVSLSSSDAHTAGGDVRALTDVLLQLPPHLKPAARAARFTLVIQGTHGAEAWPRQRSLDRKVPAAPAEPATSFKGWTSIALSLNSGDSFMATGPRSRSKNTVIKRGEAHGIAIGLQYRKTNAIPKTKPPRFLLSTSLGLNNRKMQEAMSLGLPVVLVGDLMRCRTIGSVPAHQWRT